MRGFLKGLFDFFWPYFAAGTIAGTLVLLIYGLGGYIKAPGEATAADWILVWLTICAVFTAVCAVMSIVLEVIGFVLFLLGCLVVALCKRVWAK